jgi:hypothetical protein
MNEEKNDYGDFKDLLINKPPHSSIKCPNFKQILNVRPSIGSPGIYPNEVYESKFKIPSIELYCSSDQCGGIRVFESPSPDPNLISDNSEEIVRYICRNCHASFKTYWILFTFTKEALFIKKLCENPPFGPHITSKLITVLRESRDLFVKGMRCESQNLGIGAFVYYRRVIENQKN